MVARANGPVSCFSKKQVAEWMFLRTQEASFAKPPFLLSGVYMTDEVEFRTEEESKAFWDDVTLRANIIDGIVRTMIVIKDGTYDRDSNAIFDRFDVRSAVAMALSLYADKDTKIIEMMNKLTSRD